MKHQRRFIELDLWRGLAVIAMIIFHAFFFLDFYQMVDFELYQGLWLVFVRLIQWSFLLLVGIGIALSFQKRYQVQHFSFWQFYRHQLTKALLVSVAALLINLFTFLVIPDRYIRFGVLHLITAAIIILSSIANRPWIVLVFGMTIVTITPLIKGIPFGTAPPSFSSVDYFPIFPWLAVPCVGIFLGHFLYHRYARTFAFHFKTFTGSHIITLMGRHALIIYLLHAPILMGIVLAAKFMIGL